MATPRDLVGTRVRHVDGHAGTLRYIGPLLHVADKDSSQVWCGVEWDDEGLGKHDGAVQGCRYFQCPRGKGSLIKRDKIKLAISLMQALTQRYTEFDESTPFDPTVLMKSRYRTHGADPFLRDASTGAFINVRQTDCQANTDLSCVATADERCPCREEGTAGATVIAADIGGSVETRDADGSNGSAALENAATPPPRWMLWHPLVRPEQRSVAAVGIALSGRSKSDEEDDAEEVGAAETPQPGTSPSKYRRLRKDDDAHVVFPLHAVVGDLTSWFPNLRTLILKGTLLASWYVVFDVAAALPSLESLNVSNTAIGPLCTVDARLNELAQATRQRPLKAFSASDIHADLCTLAVVLAMFPSLNELGFGCNPLFLATDAIATFRRSWQSAPRSYRKQADETLRNMLLVLHLNKTEVVDLATLAEWLSVMSCLAVADTDDEHKADGLPPSAGTMDAGHNFVSPLRLERLNLSDNHLRSIRLDGLEQASTSAAETEADHTHTPFAQVKSLWMRDSHFPTWDDFALPLVDVFPSLMELNFSDERLFAAAVPERNDGPATAHENPTRLGGEAHDFGSTFNATTLERFRFMVAAFPRQLQRLNNSCITERESAAAERLVLGRYLKRYVELAQGAHDSPHDPLPSEVGCTSFMLPYLRAFVQQQRRAGAGEIFVPKPRLKRDEFAVHVVWISTTFDDMCCQRLDGGFSKALGEHLGAVKVSNISLQDAERRRDKRISTLDVRWTVGQLWEHLVVHVCSSASDVVSPNNAFAGAVEDFWTAAEHILTAHSLPESEQVRQRRISHLSRIPYTVEEIFPVNSLLLFHYDMELASNPGAKARGLHCKHLVRPADKLFEHRIADGDAIVMVRIQSKKK